jgi:hypothetical protein
MIKAIWGIEKNNQLKADPNRSACFEDMIVAIENDGCLRISNIPTAINILTSAF